MSKTSSGVQSRRETLRMIMRATDMDRRALDRADMLNLQWLVLLHQIINHARGYEFFPTVYGPYSFALHRDIDDCSGSNQVQMTMFDGDASRPEAAVIGISPLRDKELLVRVVNAVPYYGYVLRNLDILDEKTRNAIRKLRRNHMLAQPVLHTIGYEGRHADLQMNLLTKNGVRCLVDVRSNPYSNQQGFGLQDLKGLCALSGIRYKGIPDLGISFEKRKGLSGQIERRRLLDDYRIALPGKTELVGEVLNAFSDSGTTALMCFEHDPGTCHRSILQRYVCNTYDIMRGTDI